MIPWRQLKGAWFAVSMAPIGGQLDGRGTVLDKYPMILAYRSGPPSANKDCFAAWLTATTAGWVSRRSMEIA